MPLSQAAAGANAAGANCRWRKLTLAQANACAGLQLRRGGGRICYPWRPFFAALFLFTGGSGDTRPGARVPG
jgi:hypothetical protein